MKSIAKLFDDKNDFIDAVFRIVETPSSKIEFYLTESHNLDDFLSVNQVFGAATSGTSINDHGELIVTKGSKTVGKRFVSAEFETYNGRHNEKSAVEIV